MTAAREPDNQESAAAEITSTVARWLKQAQADGALDITPAARCRICRDPIIRELVNAMLSRGFAPITVHDTLGAYNHAQPRERRITYDIVCRHRREHYNLQDPANQVYRAIAEDHYRAEGKDLMSGIGSIVTVRAFFETVMAKSYEQLIDEGPVDLEDGMKAASKLAEINRRDDGLLERAQMMADLNKAITLMRKYVPVAQWPALQAELRGEEVPAQAIEATAVRMVDISDESDEDEDPHH